MKAFLGRLSNSVSFRLTVSYGLLAVLTTLSVIFFLYFQVIDALRTEYGRQITASAQRLNLEFDEGGRPALIRAIDLTLSDLIDSDREVYLLLDEHGTKLAGNLDTLPQLPPGHGDVFEAGIVEAGAAGAGYLKVQQLAGGETLVVGHDLREMIDIKELLGRTTVASIGLALLLGLAGAYLFRRQLESRVGAIRRITHQIGAGKLSERVPLSSSQDEFALLSNDINTMLDRIESLMRSSRHISDTIAHNLRTPLTRIMGHLQQVGRPGASPARLLDANRHAVAEIQRLNELFGKLLQIAEIEAGVQRRAFKPCNPRLIAADVVEMYETLAEDKGVALILYDQGSGMVPGDANLLASAMANLVDNAVKHAHGRVEIVLDRHGDGWIRIVVKDDGPGMPAAEYESLGKHFYRLDPSSSGHGLGLTSVLGIVELHGGQWGFSDNRPGLIVTVLLPAVSAGSDE